MTRPEEKPEYDAFHAFEHDFWNITAEPYDKGFGHVTSQSIPYLLKKISGQTLLDVACGPGYITKALQDKNIKVTGIDFSEAMIDFAKKQYPNEDFQVSDAENLPFENDSFDAVCCNSGILHFPNAEIAMAEAYRVCKKDGYYTFAIWNTPDKSPAMRLIMEAVEQYATTTVDLPEGPPFFQYADQDKSFSTLNNIGFTDLSFEETQLIWPIKSGADFLKHFHDGGARIGSVLRAQSQDDLQNIIDHIDETLTSYKKDDGGYKVPVSTVIVSGRK